MKSIKPIHILLIVGNLFLYGYIASMIFSAEAEWSGYAVTDIPDQPIRRRIDTLPAHRIDPFHPRRPRVVQTKPTPKPKSVRKPEVRLPPLEFVGKTRKGDSYQLTFKLNGKIYFASAGDEVQQLTFVAITVDSAIIRYQNTRFARVVGM